MIFKKLKGRLEEINDSIVVKKPLMNFLLIKIILVSAVFIIILLAFPVLPFVLATTDEIRFIAEQDAGVNITEPCFNNDTYCSNTAQCNITIKDPQQIVLINNLAMKNMFAYHSYYLNETYTSLSGVFEATVICIDGTSNGYDTFYFKITPNGQEPSLVQGMVYVILLVIFMILVSFTILGAFHLDGKNQYDFGGRLIKINVNKYIKIGLFFISYFFLVVIFLFCEMIADNFLIISFASGIFHALFILSAIGFFPVLLGTVVLWILRLVADVYVYKLNKRGLKPR